MAYQYIVLDSLFNFDRDGEFAGFIDVNGKAAKEKAIRDDDLAGEILTSLLEVIGAIVVSVFTAGAASGAYVGRIASFISKGVKTATRISTKIVNFAGKAAGRFGQAVRYGTETILKGYVKGAAEVGKAAIFGVPTRIAKGDEPKDILKGYGISILAAGSIRTVGKAAYDNFLFRRLIKVGDIEKGNFSQYLLERNSLIENYGIKSQVSKFIELKGNFIRKNSSYGFGINLDKKLSIKNTLKILFNREFKGIIKFNDIDTIVGHGNAASPFFGIKFLSSTVSDDITKALLKGVETASLINVGKQLSGIFRKYIFAKLLQIDNKYVKRILSTLQKLLLKQKNLIKKVEKGYKQLKTKFYQYFNFEKVKSIFDKKELRIFKNIRESSYSYTDEKDKIKKEAIANDFIAKNQKLLLFNDSNKTEGGFGSQWILGYKWITRYNKETNEIDDNGSLRIYFKARIPKNRYKTKNVLTRKKDANGKRITEKRTVERKLFKAAITFKQVPFAMFEEMINSSSPGRYYWDNFAKQPNNKVSGKEGWKPRTYADINFLMGRQNVAGIYGLHVRNLSQDILKQSMGYSNVGRNILKFQGKSKEVINFIKNPFKQTTRTVSQNFKKINMLKRTNR